MGRYRKDHTPPTEEIYAVLRGMEKKFLGCLKVGGEMRIYNC